MYVFFVIQIFTKCFQILYELEYTSQAVGHVPNHLKIFLHDCIETFLHDWLKWFQTCLMIKIVHNLSSWLKKSCTFDSNVKHDVKKSIIYYVLDHI